MKLMFYEPGMSQIELSWGMPEVLPVYTCWICQVSRGFNRCGRVLLRGRSLSAARIMTHTHINQNPDKGPGQEPRDLIKTRRRAPV